MVDQINFQIVSIGAVGTLTFRRAKVKGVTISSLVEVEICFFFFLLITVFKTTARRAKALVHQLLWWWHFRFYWQRGKT